MESTVFVSFCSKDNPGDYIQEFVDKVFEFQLGGIRPGKGVYFFPADHRAYDISTHLKDQVRKSRFMISFLSEAYVRSPHCLDELEWFFEEHCEDKYDQRHLFVDLSGIKATNGRKFLDLDKTSDIYTRSSEFLNRIDDRNPKVCQLYEQDRPSVRFRKNSELFLSEAEKLREMLRIAMQEIGNEGIVHAPDLKDTSSLEISVERKVRVYLGPPTIFNSQNWRNVKTCLTEQVGDACIVTGDELTQETLTDVEYKQTTASLESQPIDLVVELIGMDLDHQTTYSDRIDIKRKSYKARREILATALSKSDLSEFMSAADRLFIWTCDNEAWFDSETQIRKMAKDLRCQLFKECDLGDFISALKEKVQQIRKVYQLQPEKWPQYFDSPAIASEQKVLEKPMLALPDTNDKDVIAENDQARSDSPLIYINATGPGDLDVAREAASLLKDYDVWTTPRGTTSFAREEAMNLLRECDQHIVICGERNNPKAFSAKFRQLRKARFRGRQIVNKTFGCYNPDDFGFGHMINEHRDSRTPEAGEVAAFIAKGLS